MSACMCVCECVQMSVCVCVCANECAHMDYVRVTYAGC